MQHSKYCKCYDCSVDRHEKAIEESFKVYEEQREWMAEQWEYLR